MLDLIVNPVTLAVLALYVGFIALDLTHRPRAYPAIPHWRLKGLAAFTLYMAVAIGAPMLWDAFLAEHRLLDLTALPLWAQVGIGLLVFELGMYAWHRTLHGADFLWRHLHQTHHSAERIDIWSAFWFHPLDMFGWVLQGSLCLAWIVGLQLEAVILVTLLTSFMAMFTHANLRTPRWLGYLITRPEMHAAHHERGVHRSNYCDLPVIDMVFGTWNNPRGVWNRPAGFYDGASTRALSLLLGRRLA